MVPATDRITSLISLDYVIHSTHEPVRGRTVLFGGFGHWAAGRERKLILAAFWLLPENILGSQGLRGKTGLCRAIPPVCPAHAPQSCGQGHPMMR